MTIQEATREALKSLKGKPLKEKAQYILTYYWVPIAACLTIAFIAGVLIHGAVTKKEPVLCGYCINATQQLEESDRLIADFSAHAGITDKQEVNFFANLSTSPISINDTMQALTIHVAAQEVDFIASDKASCEVLAQYGYFCDLTEKFTAQQLEKMAPYLLYAERSVITREEGTMMELPPLPTLTTAEQLKDPVPVALRIGADTPFTKAYTFTEKEAVMLIIPNGRHTDMLHGFLDFILDQPDV